MNPENPSSAYPDRDPDLFYELARDRLEMQLTTIDALDNKIGLLVSLASGLLGILAAVFALSATRNDEAVGVTQLCVLAVAAVAYVVVAWFGIKAYRCRSWNVGPDLRQVWDDLWGNMDDAHLKWEVARDLWAYYDSNCGAQNLKADALLIVFVGVVIQTALVVLALALVAVGV
jgi:hypothetical protein